MKINKSDVFQYSQLITLKDQEFLEKQRVAGKVAAGALMLLEKLVKEGTSLNCLQLNNLAEEYIYDNGCIPTFKGYKGHSSIPFPSGVCISVNNELVHGVPKEYYLKEGDLISFDLGATKNEAIADSALTCIYGQPINSLHLKLVETTKECLEKAIQNIRIGERIGIIGEVIYKHAKNNGFNVIDSYGGHGIDLDKPHANPFVSNKDKASNGVRAMPGMSIAIEPLLCLGSEQTKISDEDGWTVNCSSLCSHEEHSIFIHEDKIEIITERL